MKNVLLTNMSILPGKLGIHEYCGEFTNAQGITEFRCCQGIGQLEAGTKYFLSKVKIDRVIVIGTEATAKKTHVLPKNSKDGIPLLKTSIKDLSEYEEISADDYYKERILQFIKSDATAGEISANAPEQDKLSMVPLEENRGLGAADFAVIRDVAKPHEKAAFEVDNVQGIVNAILGEFLNEEICLYIDMQGGIRTSGYVRNAVLSILGNEKDSRVKIEEIIATGFDTSNQVNLIINETKRYKIMDLAAAMNSFVRYGKVDLLKTYCEERDITPETAVTTEGQGTALGRLLWLMEKVDDSISLCNISGLQEAIAGMKRLFEKEGDFFKVYGGEQTDDQVFVKSVFEILKEGIRRDYGGLLEVDRDRDRDKYTLELISWCTRKGFLQQALTLVEDQMPQVFLKKEQDITNDKYVLKYRETDANELKEFGEIIGQTYYEEENNLFYNLDKHLWQGWYGSIYKSIISRVNPSVPKTFDTGESVSKNGVPAKIIADILLLNDLNLNDESTLLDEGKLEEIAECILDKNNKDFIETYCEFRICNSEAEVSKVLSKDVRAIYYKIKQAGFGFAQKPFLTLVHMIGGSKKYRVQKNNVTTERHLEISIKPEYSQHKRKLDDLFLFHRALKEERNCANHAANKGVRLPASVVKRALEIYVEEAKRFVND